MGETYYRMEGWVRVVMDTREQGRSVPRQGYKITQC